jgi:antitoxin CptB
MDHERIDERSLSKLKWRSRRGLLENDLFIERFFRQYESSLTVRQSAGLNALMSLSDHDLLDLNLGRKPLTEVAPELDCAEVHEVLTMLQNTY